MHVADICSWQGSFLNYWGENFNWQKYHIMFNMKGQVQYHNSVASWLFDLVTDENSWDGADAQKNCFLYSCCDWYPKVIKTNGSEDFQDWITHEFLHYKPFSLWKAPLPMPLLFRMALFKTTTLTITFCWNYIFLWSSFWMAFRNWSALSGDNSMPLSCASSWNFCSTRCWHSLGPGVPSRRVCQEKIRLD